jgi:hypothetical protein
MTLLLNVLLFQDAPAGIFNVRIKIVFNLAGCVMGVTTAMTGVMRFLRFSFDL